MSKEREKSVITKASEIQELLRHRPIVNIYNIKTGEDTFIVVYRNLYATAHPVDKLGSFLASEPILQSAAELMAKNQFAEDPTNMLLVNANHIRDSLAPKEVPLKNPVGKLPAKPVL